MDAPRLVRMTEATLSFDEQRQAVQEAIEASLGVDAKPNAYVWVQDLSSDWAVYNAEGLDDDVDGLWRTGYTLADDGTVTLTGTPEKVHVEYAPITEAVDHLEGRIVEARGTDADGARIFAAQIIQQGTSRNGNRYPRPCSRKRRRCTRARRRSTITAPSPNTAPPPWLDSSATGGT
jgi:hypothetical protein